MNKASTSTSCYYCGDAASGKAADKPCCRKCFAPAVAKNNKWTDGMIKKLIELGETKMTRQQITNKINSRYGTNFTLRSVIGKLHRERDKIKIPPGDATEGILWTE